MGFLFKDALHQFLRKVYQLIRLKNSKSKSNFHPEPLSLYSFKF